MSNRLERLREYRQQKGPRGESYSMQNLAYWANRASENSNTSHRAKSGPVELTDSTNMGLPSNAKEVPHAYIVMARSG
jgi:hypothetical protein